MCGFCNNYDDYDRLHGHTCDFNCEFYCEDCQKTMCDWDTDNYKEVNDVKLCLKCHKKGIGYDDMGNYFYLEKN